MPRHFDHAAVIEERMQHGKRFIARHVNLVEHSEATRLRTFDDRAGTESHTPFAQRVRAQESFRIHLDVKRNIPDGPTEHRRKIGREDVLARRFRSDEQQMLACEERRDRPFDHVAAFIDEWRRRRRTGARRQRELRADACDRLEHPLRHALCRPVRCNGRAII